MTTPSMVNWIQYGLPTSATARSNSRVPMIGDAEADDAAGGGEQQALDQQLPHDAPARRAHRVAHRDLARPCRRARQQQVRHVGARDQQHEADRAHQGQEHDADRAGVEAFVERLDDADGELLVAGRMGRGQALDDAVELGLRLRRGDAVFQAREHREVANVAAADLVRQRDRRYPELGVGRELDAGRHHADDRPRLAVDADGQAEHAAIAAVARLPEGVAEDHDALGARLVVAAPEAAAEEHRLAQQVEAVGGDPDARRVLRRRPRVAHGHRSAQEGGQAFVRGRAGAPVEQIGPRDRLSAAGGRLALDAEDVEPVGLGEGQAADQDGVDQREHRGVDADAQGQGRNRHDAEPSILDEEAQREAQVLQQAHDGGYGRGRRRLTGGPERHGRVTKAPPAPFHRR